ncbi:AcrR family transcriptional regulator [Mycobacterium frederiksbergense]|uniref:AcrR family transcriptional regulator n=1 Tax=Mycolicibacterium frederiksbergense TaxID=117567 RepID=A0ABT6L591_9MYCO|nr:TetR family transcriptional regulator [Mycolicibacterium frederiksbergense]MDH6198116.1 AcrR family transcriptional regulator [Mycolicibacterium frederiksbergense]
MASAEALSPGGDSASGRDRLLDAAMEIGGREGLRAVTYRAVAAHAGVAHGLVRHHFGTREQLLAEAFRRAAAKDSDSARLEADSIEEFASTFVESLNTSWERPLLQFDETMQAIRGGLSIDNVRQQYERYMAKVRQTIEGVGIDDADGRASAVVFAALDGLVLQHLVFRDDARTEQLLETLREVIRRLAD